MCFKDAATRLEEQGIDIGETAHCAVIGLEVPITDKFDITHDGSHPMDDIIDLSVVRR